MKLYEVKEILDAEFCQAKTDWIKRFLVPVVLI